MALQNFLGAVILVSHDRHLLRNTVDQFLLVHEGKVENYQGDLEDYSKLLLKRRTEAPSDDIETDSKKNKREQRQNSAEQRKKLAPIKQAITKIEKLLAKLDTKLAKLEDALADSQIYEQENKDQLQDLLKQQGELTKQKDDAEAEWLTLQEQLEELSTHL